MAGIECSWVTFRKSPGACASMIVLRGLELTTTSASVVAKYSSSRSSASRLTTGVLAPALSG